MRQLSSRSRRAPDAGTSCWISTATGRGAGDRNGTRASGPNARRRRSSPRCSPPRTPEPTLLRRRSRWGVPGRPLVAGDRGDGAADVRGVPSACRVYVIPSLGSIPLQSATTDRLSTFYLQLHRTGGRDGTALAPATVRRVHVTLHRAFQDAMSWGYLNRNPAALAVKPKQRSAGSVDMRTWTADELRVR
jgi:hypothetical protein